MTDRTARLRPPELADLRSAHHWHRSTTDRKYSAIRLRPNVSRPAHGSVDFRIGDCGVDRANNA